MSEITDFVSLLSKGGIVPILLVDVFVLAVGAYRGWWVPGRQYQKLEKRSDRWQQLALQSLADTDRSVSLAEFFRSVAGDD